MRNENGAPALTAGRVAAASLVFCLLSCAVLLLESALVSRELLPQNIGKVYVIAALVIASCASTEMLARRLQAGKARAAAINFVLSEALLLIGGFVAGGDGFDTTMLAANALSVAAGSITGCIISVRPKRHRKS